MEHERVIVRREPTEEKVCPTCGKTFEGLKRATFCSVLCANKASYARHREQRQRERRERYARGKQPGPQPE